MAELIAALAIILGSSIAIAVIVATVSPIALVVWIIWEFTKDTRNGH